MFKKKIAINGRFLTRRQTGQERFAIQVVNELDKICIPGQYELVVPLEFSDQIKIENINVVKYGRAKSHLWEQTDFTKYIFRHKMLSLNLCTILPLRAPGIVCIHDISYKINPQYFTTRYGRLSAIWHKINYYVAAKKSPLIFTVSRCSKREIVREYQIEPERIVVVPNGWEHIIRIGVDASIVNKFPKIRLDDYFISIGSLAPNKNIKWIFEAAKYNPNKQFVIVGRDSINEYGNDYVDAKLDNIILTGYLRDEELKYLLEHCQALIFPSYYEGFGIPPLEAIALGKEAIVANTSCLSEIFGNCVHYLDVDNANVKLDELMKSPIDSPDVLLDIYRYANAAKIIHESIQKLQREQYEYFMDF